jgi:hypothetical protein
MDCLYSFIIYIKVRSSSYLLLLLLLVFLLARLLDGPKTQNGSKRSSKREGKEKSLPLDFDDQREDYIQNI